MSEIVDREHKICLDRRTGKLLSYPTLAVRPVQEEEYGLAVTKYQLPAEARICKWLPVGVDLLATDCYFSLLGGNIKLGLRAVPWQSAAAGTNSEDLKNLISEASQSLSESRISPAEFCANWITEKDYFTLRLFTILH